MIKYRVYVRVNPRTCAYVILWAENDYLCRQIAEAQYGAGCVIHHTRLKD